MAAATEMDNSVTAGADNDTKTDEKEEMIFGTSPQPRVNVSTSGNSLQFYLARARKILRIEETCTIGGLGQAIGHVVEVAEILKREKVAVVTKIETTMVDGSGARTRFRKPKIEITLARGEFATVVSDFRRRKVTEIFESCDKEMRGTLSVDEIRAMDLPRVFYMEDPELLREAEEFLADKAQLNLPDFIRYASKIISPVLLETKFKQAVTSFLSGSSEQNAVESAEQTKGQ